MFSSPGLGLFPAFSSNSMYVAMILPQEGVEDFLKAIFEGWNINSGGAEAREYYNCLSWVGKQHAGRLVKAIFNKKDCKRFKFCKIAFEFSSFSQSTREVKDILSILWWVLTSQFDVGFV